MTSKLAIYADEALGAYGYEEKAWFLPHVRLTRFLEELRTAGLWDRIDFRTASPASESDLMLFHTPEHIANVQRRCATNEGALDHGPTFARRHVERAARHVVGAVMDATRQIAQGALKRAFLPIAGFHHAMAEQARLYCLYNDCAVALTYLLDCIDGQVAYVDIDVHQGDGVYEAFAAEPRVCIVDIHEDPRTLFPHDPDAPGDGIFPGRREDDGRGDAVGTKLNLPLKPFTTDAQYRKVWEEAERFLRAAKPCAIVFVSGVDCLRGDPLANQHLSPEMIGELTQRMITIADDYADGRLLVLGGGGYELDNVGRGWTEVVRALTS